MSVHFHRYIEVARTELKANWKPATAMLGVAILVTAIWGRVALVGVGLFGLGSYLTLSPSTKGMTYPDLKGFLMIAVLVGNGYFGLVNPKFLNYTAAAYLAVREWNFWSPHSNLSVAEQEISRLRKEHKELVAQHRETLQKLAEMVRTYNETIAQQRTKEVEFNQTSRGLAEIITQLTDLL